MVFFALTNGSTCEPNEITCSTSTLCLPRAHLCDGQVDCPDHSDEMKCPAKRQHAQKGVCWQESFYIECDGVWQCAEGEDEKGCLGCGADEWYCGVGQECYTASQRCDGTLQCSNAVDELSCNTKCQNEVACWGAAVTPSTSGVMALLTVVTHLMRPTVPLCSVMARMALSCVTTGGASERPGGVTSWTTAGTEATSRTASGTQ
ncbi:LDL receptor repeat-containing protein egg-1-like isoform X1 [Scylla paramamosain]|uniref:LDL receptor repeat-containing protein egg-1-like isoform X1 n=1 Tax=Scylla paramamosain TaxID=85552 RepID=UPI00308334DD